MGITSTLRGRKKTHVAIVGANFAGLSAAMALPADRFNVTVIDPNPGFEYLPCVPELISGRKRPKNLRIPKQRIVRRSGHTYLPEQVVELDPARGHLLTDKGQEFAFDFCICAVGGQSAVGRVEGAREHARPFQSVNASHVIGERLGDLIENRKLVSVVIVGGGSEGVEVLGEILRAHKKAPGLHVRVIEGAGRLMPHLPEVLDREVREAASPYNVHFHIYSLVKRVETSTVHLVTGETLHSDLTIWTGGVEPRALLHESGLAPAPDSWAPVYSTLQSRRFDNVFIAGDSADLPFDAEKKGYQAIAMGRTAAHNLSRLVSGRDLESFKPENKPTIVPFGNLDCYVVYNGTVLAGVALGSLKEVVYQVVMARFDAAMSPLYLARLGRRAAKGWKNQLAASMHSVDAMRRLGNVRLLKKPSLAT
ncbi:MAG: NAD(P)/FAD-dependent oxidoreductase [Desulfatibacillaceae bacterium]